MKTSSPPNQGPTIILIQARMGSSRFPGKTLAKVLDRPLLSYQIERLRRVATADTIIVATTTDARDDAIAALCAKENIACYRGSEEDVLDRYYQAAKLFHAETIVRITGDCPLIDPYIVEKVLQSYRDPARQVDYVSNSLDRTYPRGLDTEVFSIRLLEKAAKEAKHPAEREHVTPYFYHHPEMFVLGSVKLEQDFSFHRWTVDTPEDFELISKILTTLYPKKADFTMHDILVEFDRHPDWISINAHIKQKGVE